MRKFLAVGFFFLVQLPPVFSQQYNFINYSVGQGLVNSHVNRITQDARGSILFATAGGISIYNGKEFRNYSKSNGLPDNVINTVITGAGGNVWIGTEKGLAIFNGKDFLVVSDSEGLQSSNVLSLLAENDRNIWAGTDKGLCLIKSDTESYSVQKISLNGNKLIGVSCLYRDKDGNVWAGTMRDGIFYFSFNKSDLLNDSFLSKKPSEKISVDGKSCNVFHFDNSNILCGNSIRTVYQETGGTIWIGCWRSGITKISGQKIFNYANKDKTFPLNCDRIWDVQEDKNGYLWFATDGFGVERIHKDSSFVKKNIRQFSVSNGLPSNHVFCIYLDREENLWFGTYNGGASKLSDMRFVNYLSGITGVEKNILSIFQDKEENYWFGTFGGGVFRVDRKSSFENSEMKNYSWNQGISESGVKAINQTNDGILLFGTNGGGISILHPKDISSPGKVFSIIKCKKGLPFNFITVLFKDSKGNIWAGSEEGGVCKITFSGTAVRELIHISTKSGLSSNLISSIYEDKDGQIWIGTEKGVNVIMNPDTRLDKKINTEKQQIKIYNEKNGLSSNRINCISSDKLGRIWLGTDGDGIIIYQKNEAGEKFIPVTEGLTSRQIVSFIWDNDGNIWVGTNQGVNRISLDYKGNIVLIKKYSKTEGATAMECYKNSAICDTRGVIWFGTVNGAAKYLRAADKPNMVEPITKITGIKINFNDANWEKYKGNAEFTSLTPWFRLPENLVLPYYENRITFDFVAASVRNPEKVKYRFYLEGLDKNWSPVTSENYISYSSIPPGEYTFYLQASNCDNVWNKRPVKFHFIITAPFWKTKWFIALCGILSVGFVIIIIKIREQRLHIQKRRLEQHVKIHTAEVEKQKEIIDKKNKYIVSSIDYAKHIQHSFLPPESEFAETFKEYFILYLPKDIVSGDFYWLSNVFTTPPRTNEGKKLTVLAVVDCTGHGVPGAFMSIVGNTLLNQTIKNPDVNSPAEALNFLNTELPKNLNKYAQNGTMRDGMDIAMCAFDFNSRKLFFAGANNSIYLIRSKELTEIGGDKQSICGHVDFPKENFTNRSIDICEGDNLYLFSDGYVDQFGGPKGEKFQCRQFEQLLLSVQDKPMREQKKIILDAHTKWKGEVEQLDDILVIGVKL